MKRWQLSPKEKGDCWYKVSRRRDAKHATGPQSLKSPKGNKNLENNQIFTFTIERVFLQFYNCYFILFTFFLSFKYGMKGFKYIFVGSLSKLIKRLWDKSFTFLKVLASNSKSYLIIACMHCNFSWNLFLYSGTTDNNYKKQMFAKISINMEFEKDYEIFSEGVYKLFSWDL